MSLKPGEGISMKLGLIGLDDIGKGLSHKLRHQGKYEVWGYRRNYAKANEAYESGHVDGITTTIENLVKVIRKKKNGGDQPGVFLITSNEGEPLDELLRYCSEGDIIINYGHSHSENSWETEQRCSKFGIPYINCTVSSDIYDMGNGYGFMVIGGDTAVTTCKSIFNSIGKWKFTTKHTQLNYIG